MAELGELAAKVTEVHTAGWRKYPSLPLARVAGRLDEVVAPVVRATR